MEKWIPVWAKTSESKAANAEALLCAKVIKLFFKGLKLECPRWFEVTKSKIGGGLYQKPGQMCYHFNSKFRDKITANIWKDICVWITSMLHVFHTMPVSFGMLFESWLFCWRMTQLQSEQICMQLKLNEESFYISHCLCFPCMISMQNRNNGYWEGLQVMAISLKRAKHVNFKSDSFVMIFCFLYYICKKVRVLN